MKINEILTIIVSSTSLIISILTFIINRRKNVNEYVSQNRLEWINKVRLLLQEFLTKYINNQPKEELLVLRNQIALFFREGVVSYSKLLNQIDLCIEHGYSKDNCDKLVLYSQNVFSEVWIRMKREVGINKKADKKFDKLFGNI